MSTPPPYKLKELSCVIYVGSAFLFIFKINWAETSLKSNKYIFGNITTVFPIAFTPIPHPAQALPLYIHIHIHYICIILVLVYKIIMPVISQLAELTPLKISKSCINYKNYRRSIICRCDLSA